MLPAQLLLMLLSCTLYKDTETSYRFVVIVFFFFYFFLVCFYMPKKSNDILISATYRLWLLSIAMTEDVKIKIVNTESLQASAIGTVQYLLSKCQ